MVRKAARSGRRVPACRAGRCRRRRMRRTRFSRPAAAPGASVTASLAAQAGHDGKTRRTAMEWNLPVIWAALIGVAVALYVVLDGFHLGIGILFPLARDASHTYQ